VLGLLAVLLTTLNVGCSSDSVASPSERAESPQDDPLATLGEPRKNVDSKEAVRIAIEAVRRALGDEKQQFEVSVAPSCEGGWNVLLMRRPRLPRSDYMVSISETGYVVETQSGL
jgi:2-phospho-L-lactate guanylyltransferase (CobY/MobA/RfbA family)